MDFFDHQERAHRNTRWLVLYFALAVVGIIVVLIFVTAFATGESPLNPEILLTVSIGVVLVVSLGALYRISELSKGGTVVAEMLGGRPLSHQPEDFREVQLRNIIEEMAIASGIPVPEVYVLDHERGMNAFAAGNSPADAVVAVTRGTLENLTRDELQGVVAHEFSHILNGDMRLNIRLMGVLNGILLLAILGRIAFSLGGQSRIGGGRSNQNGGGAVLAAFAIGLALFLVGWIGVFFAKLIKAAVSRQREFLADASAVQFTRNPDGIAAALYKIGGASSKLDTHRADEASHFFFCNGLAPSSFSSWFATHPPIDERIRAVNPNFDPSKIQAVESHQPAPETKLAPRVVSPFPGLHNHQQLTLATAILAAIPEFAKTAAHEPAAAESLIYSLLLSTDTSTRERQLASIQLTPGERSMVDADLARRSEIPDAHWLTTVDLCLPALRKLSEPQYQTFRTNVRILMEADGQIDLFEYVLQKALIRHLDGFFTRATEPAVRFRSIIPLLPDCQVILSALANFDSDDETARDASFQAGVQHLMVKPDAYPFTRTAGIDLGAIDQSLDRLAAADPATKRKILMACAHAVLSDGSASPRQAALLRAVADTLGCPVPPFVDGFAQSELTAGQ